MQMTARIEPLPWESEFFGIRCGRLILDGGLPLSGLSMAEYALVQAKVPAQRSAELDALSNGGFRLVDGEIDFLFSTDSAVRPAAIKIARSDNIPLLRAAAARLFVHSRFRPPWFKLDDCQRFYACWIENAVTGCFDDQCLLALDHSGDIAGFVSLRRLDDDTARVGLLGALISGQGTGQRLIGAALDWARAQRLSRLRVATQTSNLAAMRLYTRCGGVPDGSSWWLYR
ncbi:TDP-D-fucosamine acetyltransferase [Erwinia sp. OLTSP20]|uniref:dTDP-4-amino-4,6-dideoxy-D-galactose acyltransferase n=1 Tax=unclassified Erwinia TaxID=2622719 RepID=UPI000C180F66|nr:MULTISPECIES: dTDP-4-amino-4,6-dideoxy-D-galactose acyltransferase [unclassified Erwinia]PIJ50770.1 TDP-D-fucosamine acetyltransferase [Erwinia sp. OAMSP11]PIJ72922.1 TDP-D-fucosamine acetyltransferase [Erwinia sp. OLSSP12]PIJ81937.1 TDP-D-fucosamine acetyltransferase [Erwinia sp. OLCASP19]PIJ84592.1 TDP-D-fucosamine acetyltransferase [Erwinia sp. OLMTSP26]PIJ86939.1 TDP-D-fucosamine acetyltransferase [Erwinia sp. OLMDSP33]